MIFKKKHKGSITDLRKPRQKDRGQIWLLILLSEFKRIINFCSPWNQQKIIVFLGRFIGRIEVILFA